MTRFERDPERAEQLGARIEDEAQEAIDATSTAYAGEAGLHVEERLVTELWSRGLRADDESLGQVAAEIRSGHPVDLGKSDGSSA